MQPPCILKISTMAKLLSLRRDSASPVPAPRLSHLDTLISINAPPCFQHFSAGSLGALSFLPFSWPLTMFLSHLMRPSSLMVVFVGWCLFFSVSIIAFSRQIMTLKLRKVTDRPNALTIHRFNRDRSVSYPFHRTENLTCSPHLRSQTTAPSAT